MNIDFIKWMVGYAEGFENRTDRDYGFIRLPNKAGISYEYMLEDKTAYPLLLQRAIEGINRKYYLGDGTYTAYPNGASNYAIFKDEESVMDYYYEGQDESKELSLKYICEQEAE